MGERLIATRFSNGPNKKGPLNGLLGNIKPTEIRPHVQHIYQTQLQITSEKQQKQGIKVRPVFLKKIPSLLTYHGVSRLR